MKKVNPAAASAKIVQQAKSSFEQLLGLRQDLLKQLGEVDQVLGSVQQAPAPARAITTVNATPQASAQPPAGVRGRGRRGRGRDGTSLRAKVEKALESGPLSKQELVDKLKKLGWVPTGKNPLGSLHTLLYSKQNGFRREGKKFAAPVAA